MEFITPQTHAGRFWRRFTSYAFAGDRHIAPIVAAEISRAVLTMPLAFVRQEERFVLAAVLSPIPGENFFVDHQGRWLGAYIPSCFRGYPFSLVMEKKSGKLALGIDESSGLISDTDGEPFFDNDGQPSKALKDVLDFLQKVEENRMITDLAVAVLADAGLMIEWPLTVKVGDTEMRFPDLYRLDEAGLSNTDDETFLKLRKAQALQVGWAQLFSMGNSRFFDKLVQAGGQARKEEAPPDIDKIMGEDDIFKF